MAELEAPLATLAAGVLHPRHWATRGTYEAVRRVVQQYRDALAAEKESLLAESS